MDRCMEEVWEVVKELPGNAREMWSKAFREALVEVQGDMQKAAAMAWKAFKRQEPDDGSGRTRDKGPKGVLLVAVYGGTPEWIRLVKNDGFVIDDNFCPCLVDKRALEALIAKWEEWDGDRVILLEDHNVFDWPATVVGWIKEMKCRADGLWVMVEWTEEGLGYITRKDFGYLGLGFILDECNRPVELWQARLTNYPVLNEWNEERDYLCVQKKSPSESGRRLRLIQGVTKQEENCGKESWVDANSQVAGKDKEISTLKKFLNEMGELLQIPGDVSLKKVKEAVVELEVRQKSRQRLGSDLKMRPALQGVMGKTIEEAIKNGLIKPEQRDWAEIYAIRDWQGFNEFLFLAAAVPQDKKGLFPYIRSLLKWLVAKPQETESKDNKGNLNFFQGRG